MGPNVQPFTTVYFFCVPRGLTTGMAYPEKSCQVNRSMRHQLIG